MPLSLDEVLAAPQDPELLQRHLQTLGLVQPPALPAASPTVAKMVPPTPATLPPLERPKIHETVNVESTPTAAMEATSAVPGGATLTPPTSKALPQPLNPANLLAREPAGTSATPVGGGLEPQTLPPLEKPKLLETPRERLESFRSREQDPENISRIAPVGEGEKVLQPGTSEYTANELARMADEKAHPWGTPENHPGVIGKIGHVLGRIGNIAGDIIAPATMTLIPGTDLNRQMRESQLETRMERERKGETEAAAEKREERSEKSQAALRQAQIDNLESEAAARGIGTENLLTDKNGNVVGWKDKDATGKIVLHSLEDPETPQAIKEIAAATTAKEGVTPDERAVAAKMKEINPDTGKPYTAYEADVVLAKEKAAVKPQKDNETMENERYEKIRTDLALNRPVSDEDKAWAKAFEKRKTLGPFATAAAQAPQKGTERSDKSYDRNTSQIDKTATPIEQTAQRMVRLDESLAQNTPQADALIAPELLSIMAGGQASGLRMNEAEIDRIVGGRSHWENLKASVNKWRLDPTTARSITPEQQKEVRALVDVVRGRINEKLQIVEDARDRLLDSDDPKEHRRIVKEMKEHLDAVDMRAAGSTTKAPAGAAAPTGAGKPLPSFAEWQKNKGKEERAANP